MELRVKKTHRNAKLPSRATEGSAGLDLSAALDETVIIPPGEVRSISTGIAIEIPEGMVAFLFARSSLGLKHSVSLVNSVGVIDNDYRGTVSILLINHSDTPFQIENGDRLAQLIITSFVSPDIVEVEKLSDTERNTGGFGSTGTK
ncbi:MAG: dUTP diphosphatase [Oscillospiraceae bacterium]|nr:dUTP diphosphatase [Oscillospiraceae bacterium]